ncbi:MAG: PQQ-binding-like beta-propeller repeat protein, partial [Lachnospiraceae bacterium]|nr:PQQ-binding-like beta-propeller repeat protein [Lachnospiraceae bacterium]
MTKRLLTSFVFILSAVCLLTGWTAFRYEGSTDYNNLIAKDTATDPLYSSGQMLYKTNVTAFYGTSINSEPLISGDALYFVNSNTLYKMTNAGDIIYTFTLDKAMNSTCRMAMKDSILYIPLSDGLLEAVRDDGSSFTKLFTSEEFKNQSLCPVTIYGDYIYSATTNGAGTEGVYYCLDSKTGKTVWTYKGEESETTGFYWCQAVVYGDLIYFAADNGNVIAHSLTEDKLIDVLNITDKKIRSGLCLDKVNKAIYVVSRDDGVIHKLKILDDGSLKEEASTALIADANSVYSTSTPTLYNGRLYVGCLAIVNNSEPFGAVSVIDSENLKPLYYAKGENYGEVKSSPLVSISSAEGIRANVYVTANKLPGALYTFADIEDYKNTELVKLYEPDSEYQQYTYQSVVSDDYGNLYYSNDSGALFKISKSDKPNLKGVINVSIKKQNKKKLKISYLKPDDGADTLIYYKYNKKTYKKLVTSNKKSYTLTYKKVTGKNGKFKKNDIIRIKI